MLYEVENKRVLDVNKPMHRIVYNFLFVGKVHGKQVIGGKYTILLMFNGSFCGKLHVFLGFIYCMKDVTHRNIKG